MAVDVSILPSVFFSLRKIQMNALFFTYLKTADKSDQKLGCAAYSRTNIVDTIVS
jgi:hypothetical protein